VIGAARTSMRKAKSEEGECRERQRHHWSRDDGRNGRWRSGVEVGELGEEVRGEERQRYVPGDDGRQRALPPQPSRWQTPRLQRICNGAAPTLQSTVLIPPSYSGNQCEAPSVQRIGVHPPGPEGGEERADRRPGRVQRPVSRPGSGEGAGAVNSG
jgi:hypothetical protein